MTTSRAASGYSTGLELILNACESVLQIAVTENEKPLCFEEWFAPGRATEILAPALEQICMRLAIRPGDFRRIGCFAGPGSFTGIRLVLATAAALRRTGRARLASLDYLQALATSAVMRRAWLYPGKVFVVTHARRDLVHFQEFVSFGPVIPAQPASDVELLEPAAALGRIQEQRCLVCGSGLERHAQLFVLPPMKESGQGSQIQFMPDLVNPDLGALRLLARHGDYFPADVEPKYARGCDAVENLVEREGGASQTVKQLEAILKTSPESRI
ncbi:MAG: tRNA (adenosine(37)-N6)-threonylcarbamoyltransferase complex dimerization subunit type 1 TsaB [Desulfovibrio sp.]|nr:tRNA (adenosine(37)-N6)-threonylcarbamoyltransferase complex dimerization subunit type 1 TsaB [Desulfovibrio sp.]